MKRNIVFSRSDRERIERAVAEAEGRTSGEIVLVMTRRSDRYHRAADLFMLLCGLLALALSRVMPLSPAPWTGRVTEIEIVLNTLLWLLSGGVTGAGLAALCPSLLRPFVGGGLMAEAVERRAAEAFHRYSVSRTAGRTGVLIFLSLFERRVIVIGDEAISARVVPDDWESIRDRIIDGVHEGDPVTGLCDAVGMAGRLLERHFPRSFDDRNEAGDQLREMDS